MKKGFTLVELLCVIIIIAVVSGIVFPIVLGNINKSKEELLKVQIKDIETAAKKWALANLNSLDKYHINDVYVSIEYLQDTNFLDKDVLLNPETKEEMEGCVLIKYDFDSKQYTYSYDEIDCKGNFTPEDSDAYIVYTSSLNSADESHAKKPFFQTLIDNNDLKVDGETTPGLYDLDGEYVFRGTNNNAESPIRNYVEYAGHTWRILSISKDDYTMKLIGSSNPAIWSSEGKTNYAEVEQFSTFNLNDALVNKTWYNGIVDSSLTTLADVKSALMETTINKNIGLLSIFDYAVASSECSNNIFDGSCKNNNYLYEMFNGSSAWTMNTDSMKIWYINPNGGIALENPADATYNLYPVVKVPVSVYQTGSDIDTQVGSSSSPYKITSQYKPVSGENNESNV